MRRPAKPSTLVQIQPLPPNSSTARFCMKNNDILSEIMRDVISKRLNTAVLAGHYCLSENMSELSHQEESEQASFAYGASIVGAAREYGLPSSLVLWVNDIGVNPEEAQGVEGKLSDT